MGGFVQKSRVTFIARQPPLDAMNGLFDRELLPLLSSDRRGEGSRADDAFQKIVERYVNLVHASALRQVRDFALAEDVTQAVFIVLWNKSATVRDAAALPAWLLSVTHWVARDAIKRRTIRHRHEQQAAALNGTNAMNTDASVDFNVLAANLDAALNRLAPADRSVVAMRYLSGRSFKEVSESMGISEEAARKRSSRALERLRDLLSKHGVHSAADLLENSLAQLALLPAGDSTAVLADKIVAACHGTAGASASVGTLSKTAQLVITMSKIKTAALVASAVALALAGGAVVSVKMVGSGGWLEVPQQTVVVPPEQTAAAAASAALPPVPDYTGPYAAQLANGYQFQVIGVCRNPRESKAWWEPDGTPMSSSPLLEPLDFARFDDLTRAGRPANYSTGDEYAIVMRVPNLPLQPDGFSGDYNCSFSPGSLRWAFSQPRIALPSTREYVLIELVWIPNTSQRLTMTCTAETGPWEPVAKFDSSLQRIEGNPSIHLSHTPKSGGAEYFNLTFSDPQIVARDKCYVFVGVVPPTIGENSIVFINPPISAAIRFLGDSTHVRQYDLFSSQVVSRTVGNIALSPAAIAPSDEVFIAGKVARGGVYSLSQMRTLRRLVIAAGIDGLKPDRTVVKIIHGKSSPVTSQTYSLLNVLQGTAGSIPLTERDIIQISDAP